jgi:hypothetical protein
MAKNSVNLNKLKEEIDIRKKEKNMVSSQLGENVGSGVAPRDTFLNGLITSLKTGNETASSNLIKLVENKVAAKQGETVRHNVDETKAVPPASSLHNAIPLDNQTVDMSPERDEQLFADLEIKRKQTLAESMQKYVGGAPTNKPVQQRPQMNLNEGYLVENVKKIVDNYLIENFGPIVEEAIKSTILELYAVERIKEVLQENKEMVKTVVREVIREIQAANAKKKAQL